MRAKTDSLTPAESELLARRREIADAAIAIADEQGIDAVSMRNISARLGVGTMTLYTWVENKDDLIAAMGDALAAQMLVPEPLPEDWREALRLIAVATRDIFAEHPWMLSRDRPRAQLGANMLRHVDQSLRAVKPLELDWQLRSSILQAVDNYALGYAIGARRRGRRVAVGSERGDAANAVELRELFASGEAPALIELFDSPEDAVARIRQGPPEVENAFDDGLDWLLDGIAAMVERRGGR
jgi:AcrR family transcriptional regulator